MTLYSVFGKRFQLLGLVALCLLLLFGCGNQSSNGTGNASEGNGTENEGWKPTQSIKYIAPAGAGGGWDTLARTTARVLEETGLSPVPMPVENMPGAGGSIGWTYIANHEGDPHHLFVTSPPIVLVPLSGQTDLTHRDFTPVARLITDYMIIGVSADSPYQSLSDLVEDLQNRGRDISIAGGSAPGSMDHIAIVGAMMEAGVPASHINYTSFEGGAQAIAAVLGGHADVVTTGVGESTEHVRAGNLRILGVSAPERIDVLADVPTYREQGIDYTFDLWRGVMAPKSIPDEALTFYENMFREMLETDEWKEAAGSLGWTNAYLDSKAFGVFLDEMQELFSHILEELGLD